jgi:hypothetical protein
MLADLDEALIARPMAVMRAIFGGGSPAVTPEVVTTYE